MIYFPNNEEEIALIKFIAKFQYLSVNDAKYFFSSNKYYKKRITKLVDKKYLRRVKTNLVLGELGIEYCKLFKYEYTILNRNKKYLTRLLYISNLAAFYNSSTNITFNPSFAMKDKEMFTITARKFVGVFNINGFEYLAYSITKERSEQYIKTVIYDIEKEHKYKNIIVLVDDIKRIDLNSFSFGNNKVLILEDNIENREKLKSLHSINWSRVMENVYRHRVYLAEYNFCDYTDHKNKYISYFYFLDCEKINRIKYFLRENRNKNADIICPLELKEEIQKELPNANYHILDLEEFIDKEKRIYD